jgi:MFS family permease
VQQSRRSRSNLRSLEHDREKWETGFSEEIMLQEYSRTGEVVMAQMTDVSTSAPGAEAPWYKSLTGSQWRTLLAANLGWLFDGYETYALILTVGPAMHSLLEPSQYSQIPTFAGTVISITLLGWGIGGICGGIFADYFGRRRTMIYAILAYSIMTGLTAFSFNWISFAILRFLVGIAIGSEWATGTSMLAELWPQNARGKGAGLMQCGLGIGFFLASLIWLFVSGFGPDAWRYMFVIGILPALLTVWIRTSIDESHAWQSVDAQRKDAQTRKDSGATLNAHEQALTRFTVADLFVDPTTRRHTIIVFLMSLTTTLAWWGISSWVPPYIASVAAKAGQPAAQWASYAGMAYNFGAILGYASLGFLADRFGRKPVVMIFFALAFVMTPVLFLWTQDLTLLLVAAAVNAFFTLGQYSWMPVWLPELFPTRSRATGLAFTFNAPRFIAFLGPLYAGFLITQFGGFSHAAMTIACIYALGFVCTPFLPETNGKPLPA